MHIERRKSRFDKQYGTSLKLIINKMEGKKERKKEQNRVPRNALVILRIIA